MDVLQLLKKTRELLSSPSKWVKQSLYDDGGYCLVGALQFAAKHETYNEESDLGWPYNQARMRCQAAIWEQYNNLEWDPWDPMNQDELPDIPGFNDREETEHEQIVAVLDRAIKLEEKILDGQREDN